MHQPIATVFRVVVAVVVVVVVVVVAVVADDDDVDYQIRPEILLSALSKVPHVIYECSVLLVK